jgi:hypothetical protein
VTRKTNEFNDLPRLRAGVYALGAGLDRRQRRAAVVRVWRRVASKKWFVVA